jgi:hypothetical protein
LQEVVSELALLVVHLELVWVPSAKALLALQSWAESKVLPTWAAVTGPRQSTQTLLQRQQQCTALLEYLARTLQNTLVWHKRRRK